MGKEQSKKLNLNKMHTPNRPTSPEEFYQTMQEAKEKYSLKMEENKNSFTLSSYYEGRLDMVNHLIITFDILFYEVKYNTRLMEAEEGATDGK